MRSYMVIVLLLLAAIGAAAYLRGWHEGGAGSGDPRYDEIADLIDDNLHFGRHFTWAVTVETIAEMRRHVTPADISVLIRMLGDESGTVAVAASGLLTTLGAAARPALAKAAESPDWRVSMRAHDALSTLEQCETDPARMNPDACP